MFKDVIEEHAREKLTPLDFKRKLIWDTSSNGEDSEHIFYMNDIRKIFEKQLSRAEAQHCVVKPIKDALALIIIALGTH